MNTSILFLIPLLLLSVTAYGKHTVTNERRHAMKRWAIVVLTAATFLGLLLPREQAMSAPVIPHLNWGSQVNIGQCLGESSGLLVINVVQKVVNGVDSRVGGGYWAQEDYNKHIQVWQEDATIFCAVVRYTGSWTTFAGQSPQNLEPIDSGIEGTFQGGYRATIEGSLLESPLSKTKGNIGRVDYQCNSVGNCPGADNWLELYFDSPSFSFQWWGWVYHGGNNGTWVNSVDGNQGDITD